MHAWMYLNGWTCYCEISSACMDPNYGSIHALDTSQYHVHPLRYIHACMHINNIIKNLISIKKAIFGMFSSRFSYT